MTPAVTVPVGLLHRGSRHGPRVTRPMSCCRAAGRLVDGAKVAVKGVSTRVVACQLARQEHVRVLAGVGSRSPPDSIHRLAHRKRVGRLVTAFDWASTSIGVPSTWPRSVSAVVRIVLSGGFPAIVLWGDVLLQIYNDGYCKIMGLKQPG